MLGVMATIGFEFFVLSEACNLVRCLPWHPFFPGCIIIEVETKPMINHSTIRWQNPNR